MLADSVSDCVRDSVSDILNPCSMCLSENVDSRQADTKQAHSSTSSVGNGGSSWNDIKYIRLLIHDMRARKTKPKAQAYLLADT